MLKGKPLSSSTHEEMGSGEPMLISGNEQDVRSCLFITKGIRTGHACASPMTGFFGTDFWHAVEFSRNGRAPTRVFRPFAGQPIHAMSARCSLSKRAPSGLPGQAAPRRILLEGTAPGPAARASGLPWGVTRLRIQALHVKSGCVKSGWVELHPGHVALPLAEHQPPPVQEILGCGRGIRVGDPGVVDVGAALADG